MRKSIIAGNWKMNLNHREAAELARNIGKHLQNITSADMDIIICPSFTSLEAVAQAITGYPQLLLGAQNISWERSGALTGEISSEMLKPLGVEYVIIGHSERRHILGETDEQINKKLKRCFEEGLKPILCVGETLDEREKGIAKKVIEEQLKAGIKDIESKIAEIVIAYEPVWAIGTGKNATTNDAEDIALFIRDVLEGLQNGVANKVRIQYGGSVTPENIRSFMKLNDIDGVLVGGASLKAEQFLKIINYRENEGAALLS